MTDVKINVEKAKDNLSVGKLVNSKNSDFFAFVDLIKQNFLSVLIITFVFGLGSIAYSLSLSNEYRSFSKIAAVSEDKTSGLGALASQFGGLASMAGVSIGGGGDVNVITETLESRDFIKLFIDQQKIAVPLFAAKDWDRETNTLIIDEDIYDESNKKWVREVEPYQSQKPSSEELFLKFKEIMSFSKNKKTDLLTISITFYSPEISKQWVESLLVTLSEYLRNKERLDAEQSIEFIESQYTNLNNSELRMTLSQLLQEQYQKLTLVNIKKNFGFEVRDSAFLPEEKSGPKRVLIVLGITFIGGVIALFFIFFKTYLRMRTND